MRHGELVPDLKAGAIALARAAVWLADEVDGEASLSVYEPCDPTDAHKALVLARQSRQGVIIGRGAQLHLPKVSTARRGNLGWGGYAINAQMWRVRTVLPRSWPDGHEEK